MGRRMEGTRIFIDTHVLVWLYTGEIGKFSETAINTMNNHLLAISPMVLFELDYLRRKRILNVSPSHILRGVNAIIPTSIDNADFNLVIEESIAIDWTSDPFDRIIVGQAQLSQSYIVSKDRKVRDHYQRAIW